MTQLVAAGPLLLSYGLGVRCGRCRKSWLQHFCPANFMTEVITSWSGTTGSHGDVGRDPAHLACLLLSASEGDPELMWWNGKQDRKRPRELIVGYLLSLVIVGLALALWRLFV